MTRFPQPQPATDESPLFVHLGCGSKFIPGFIHVDIIPLPRVDIVGPVEKLPDFEDDSVDLIYASHVLEHFGRDQYLAVLAEWHRVLKPMGVLRLAVPNFKACVEQYLLTGRIDGATGILGLLCGGQRHEYDYHRMVFDQTLLEQSLLKVGFKECRTWDWRVTQHTSVDDYSQAYLPHMEKATGRLMSLNLEAIK